CIPIIIDNRFIGVQGISRDITEKKKAEEEIRKLSTAVEQSPSVIAITDLNGNLEYVNPKFTELTGYTNEEVIGQNPRTLKSRDQPDEMYEELWATISSGNTWRGEFHNRKKNGDLFWEAASVSPIFDKQGEITNYIKVAEDISERKQAEEALRESEERLQAIFEASPNPIVVYDTEGNLQYLNAAFTELFAWTLKELKDRRVPFVPDDQKVLSAAKIDEVYRSGKPARVQTRRLTKAGDTIDVLISAASIKGLEGKPIGMVVNLTDLSEQIKLQTQLNQAQKMEAIGTLAGGVAHDLNNILGGLVSYPELLLLQLPPNSPLRKSILTIQKSGEKAAAVVQDLLTLARRGVVVTEVVSLNNVISEYLKSPEHEKLQSYHPGVHIETRLEADILNILGSSTHLSKTAMNLISNAAEAMPEGGNLIVSTENRYIDRPIKGYDDVREGDYVVLTISDTGTGIASDDLDKIFEPFYTKKKMGRSGTGLGMAVVWGTVKDHNGYIDVQSTEGKGTTFTLYFSATREKLSEDKSNLAIESYSGNGESILVIDDVEEQKNIASGMLKELGYSVVSVSSGEKAVEYLKTNKVDLLLLDMIMDPGMDGLDTYKKILKLHPGQKAIIASGFSETGRVKEVQNLGAGAYIRKPLLLEKIGIAVKKELEK
ncbi:MAG: PAS domain S-box protein, partial [Deltaproteobacteria bacterium]|nr:PAS domain S-box protein [Deltaproteobacteria bacterium]